MNREDTINNGQACNPEDTVTDDTRHYGNPEGEDTATGETADPGTEKPNTGRRAAAAAAVIAGAATASAAAYMMGVGGEEAEAEDIAAGEPAAEPESPSHVHAHTHPQPEPQPDPTPEPEPTPEPDLQPEPIVAVEPEVEILGVEVLHTDEGDVTLGGISVNGEEYVLVDVDGGDFDAAWHDDNHDHQVQESEIIDISDEHISVEGFTELAEQQEHPMEDIPASTGEVAPHDDLLAQDDMDQMGPGETDYMIDTDDSGLV